VIKFKDGGEIYYNNQADNFGNTLIGTLYHQLNGTITFTDKQNGLVGTVQIGQIKGKPKDYIKGEIVREDGTKVSDIFGNYMGYIECDQQRFYDIRQLDVREIAPLDINDKYCLRSDSRWRPDSFELRNGNMDAAQSEKEGLEKIQRHDRKLREEAAKRRKKGGPKIVYSYRQKN